MLFLLGVLEGCFIGCIVACGNLLRATNILRGMEVALLCNAYTHKRRVCPRVFQNAFRSKNLRGHLAKYVVIQN